MVEVLIPPGFSYAEKSKSFHDDQREYHYLKGLIWGFAIF